MQEETSTKQREKLVSRLITNEQGKEDNKAQKKKKLALISPHVDKGGRHSLTPKREMMVALKPIGEDTPLSRQAKQ